MTAASSQRAAAKLALYGEQKKQVMGRSPYTLSYYPSHAPDWSGGLPDSAWNSFRGQRHGREYDGQGHGWEYDGQEHDGEEHEL